MKAARFAAYGLVAISLVWAWGSCDGAAPMTNEPGLRAVNSQPRATRATEDEPVVPAAAESRPEAPPAVSRVEEEVRGDAASEEAPAPERIVFPADAGVHDIRAEFGAKGDGVTDDTEAIRRAFKKYSKASHMVTVYIPSGIYLVSDQVWFSEWIFVQGESRKNTVFRLKDNCPGYQDPTEPKRVLGTLVPKPGSNMNMNFSTHLLDVTVDTGRGNPGAIGIQFMSHNGGGLENVTIRSGDGSGAVGLDMRPGGQGPALCRRLSIEGFDVGVWTGPSVYFSTFEDIRLSGQKQVGWINANHPFVVRHLVSENRVPVFRSQDMWEAGQIVVVDSRLTGGSKEHVAIDNSQKGKYGVTGLFLRNVVVEGYGLAAADQGRDVTVEEARREYVSGGTLEALPSTKKSLALPVKETPPLPWEDPTTWRSVMDFAPVRVTGENRHPTDELWGRPFEGHDVTKALQRGIDSGASTVYLPYGSYIVRKTIVLRGGIRVLQGCGSTITTDKEALKEGPMFRFENADSSAVFIDRLSFAGGRPAMQHASPKTLVVLHSRWMSYANAAPALGGSLGDLFVDDMCGGPWVMDHPQKMWLRSLNVESGQTKVTNTAATMWVLGYKAEGSGTDFITGARGATEVIGGSLYEGHDQKRPSFINSGGRVSATVCQFWTREVVLRDTRGGRTGEMKLPKGSRLVNLVVADE